MLKQALLCQDHMITTFGPPLIVDNPVMNSIQQKMPVHCYGSLGFSLTFAFYLSNRPQVSMGYKLINHAGCW